ncbi:calycin-like domain-containing protein [Parabacteroides sp. Marseille-P3160]|uniref:calycin-like domain-containing protein n=1 Tax=Parabacteroides sp. Marseille-P3160 TaxID=1917887 RepID=UPI00135B8A96|nr:calycin-like domain-containing protein [Parabacteroides sp. Marseille-P3160]
MRQLFTRKMKLWLAGFLAVLSVSMANAQTTSVEHLLGDYKGTLSIALGGDPIVSVDTVSIAASKQENSVKFSLEDFTLTMGELVIPVGDIVLDSIPVKNLDGVDSLDTKTIDLTVDLMGQILPATVTFKGAVIQDSVFVDLNVATSMMGAPIVVPVTFKGEKIEGGGVANEDFLTAPTVWAVDGHLYINVEKSGYVRVYTLTGQLVNQTAVSPGQKTIALPKGFYIVSLNDTVQKVLIK